ncbi:hypothetical protein [Leptospira ilyithenensis]|uniref:Uncharacterized protein n=1 Tax=Leptospira ilyithenensis TaxID=2484901 RepID=A0A4R9LQR9_9LEPT|nr:hypothetical protein [Leptospira ilyithenensis]TGN10102.1 hypothetical protein EHS11_11115 [Leptospira ilyithenensis]
MNPSVQKTKNRLLLLGLVGLLCISFSTYADAKKEKQFAKQETGAGNHGILLESIGTLSAQGLYLTYMSIGTLSDGFVSQAYDKETTENIMTSYVNLSKICKDQISTLIKEGNLSADDKKFLKEIESTYGYLILQGQAILSYIATSDQTQLKAFESNRLEAWKRITKILDIKE